MKKILLVDDDLDIINVVEILLTRNNYKVKATAQWENITKSIKNFSPDLILLDVALGGADGRDICEELKSSTNTQHIPIILFSAYYNLAKDFRGCPADGFVSKPFDISYLLETISKNIG